MRLTTLASVAILSLGALAQDIENVETHTDNGPPSNIEHHHDEGKVEDIEHHQDNGPPSNIEHHSDKGKPENIEIHTDYNAPIGVDTKYLTVEDKTTKWIGVNTQYLTESIATTTIDNKETTTTATAALSVVTASETVDGLAKGDVTILVSDALRNEINDILKSAATACAGPAKRKRQSSCMIDRIGQAATDSNALRLPNPAEWESFALEMSETASPYLSALLQVAKTKTERHKAFVMLAAGLVTGVVLNHELSDGASQIVPDVVESPYKYKFPNGQVAGPKVGADQPDEPEEAEAATTTAASCDAQSTADESSPACEDEDCDGEVKKCRAEGKNKDCPCLYWAKDYVDMWDKDWMDYQQELLGELEDAEDQVPPKCFRNTNGDNFAGKPKAEPSAWCVCSQASGAGDKVNKGNFATMTGDGDAACTYKTMPTSTIEITTFPNPTPAPEVTSCRWEQLGEGQKYCTCNDDLMHGDFYTTVDGTRTTHCPSNPNPTGGTSTDANKDRPLCKGNKVQGDCIAGKLPKADDYSGHQDVVCMRADGSSGASPRVNAQKLIKEVSASCLKLVEENLILKEGEKEPGAAIFYGEAEGGGDMVFSVKFYKPACPEDKSKSELSFKELGYQKCVAYFADTFITACAQDEKWENANKEFDVMGGVVGGDCAMFSVYGQ